MPMTNGRAMIGKAVSSHSKRLSEKGARAAINEGKA